MVSKKKLFVFVFLFQGCMYAEKPSEDLKHVCSALQKGVAVGYRKASATTPAFLLTNAAVLTLIALEHSLIPDKKIAFVTAFCLALFDGDVLLCDFLSKSYIQKQEQSNVQISLPVDEQKGIVAVALRQAKEEEQAQILAEIEASPEVFEVQKRLFEIERSLSDQGLEEGCRRNLEFDLKYADALLCVEKNKAKQRIEKERRAIEKEKIEIEAAREMAKISVARVAAEVARATSEGTRATAEGARALSEKSRVSFEWLRALVEIMILLKK